MKGAERDCLQNEKVESSVKKLGQGGICTPKLVRNVSHAFLSRQGGTWAEFPGPGCKCYAE
jgi:hypothetical protein